MAHKHIPSVFITTNGCRRRALDSGRLVEYFRLNHCRILSGPKDADYLIVVTCSFIESREQECYQIIDELRQFKGEIIVLGCLPAIAEETFRQKFTGRSLITKDLLTVDSLFPDFQVKFRDVPDAHAVVGTFCTGRTGQRSLLQKIASLRPNKKTWTALRQAIGARKSENTPTDLRAAHLRISYGCVSNCAYCSIQKATGKLKSKSVADCVAEYRGLLEKGRQHFVILADDVGAYGLDIHSTFAELLQKLSEVDVGRPVTWQIRELHPTWTVKYRDEIRKRIEEGKVKHILCPVQSGSPKILNLMNRYPHAEEVQRTLQEFRKAGVQRLDTHMIVGFPSETEEDFLATLELIKAVHFDYVNVFPFWAGYGTIASKLDNQIDPAVKETRIKVAVKTLEEAGIRISWDTPRY